MKISKPVIFFLTRKVHGELSEQIVPINVCEVSPRYIRVATGRGYQRVRQNTIYHTYHPSFFAAKTCVRVDLEIRIKKLERELEASNRALVRIQNLGEAEVMETYK